MLLRSSLLLAVPLLVSVSAPAAAGPFGCGTASETDCDGVIDSNDNCIYVPNAYPLDCDTDGDGYGNVCDGDFDQSGVVNSTDFGSFFLADFAPPGSDGGTGTDMDCSGDVNATDFSSYFLPQFQLGTPGPSCCSP